MALNFPANPSPGQVFTAEGMTFVWSGTLWRTVPPAIPFATPEEAVAGVRDDVIMSPLTTRLAARKPRLVAWLTFDGAGNANIDGENLSGARTATGEFTFTFGTPLPNINYAVTVGIGSAGTGFGAFIVSNKLVGSFRFTVNRVDVATVRANPSLIDLAVFQKPT